jgi:adenosylhomocysteine nucleosidase
MTRCGGRCSGSRQMDMPPRVALIAALEREVAPLARRFIRREYPGVSFSVFEGGDVKLVCGGIGQKHAAAATRWLIANAKPEVIGSIGFAGALVADYHAGDVMTPATTIDSGTGETFSSASGRGILVTGSGVSGEAEKRELATCYQAEAVDMEAAAVARVARESGIPFFAVKAISDELGFAMPPMDRFVSDSGQFRTAELLGYAAVRPAMWPVLARLGRNAKKASSQLCGWLENQISRDFQDILGKVQL